MTVERRNADDFTCDEISAEIAKELKEYGLQHLDGDNHVYPAVVKISLVRAYLNSRNLTEAAKTVGIEYHRAYKFKAESNWWKRVESVISDFLIKDSSSAYHRVVTHATEKMVEMICDGVEKEMGGKKKRMSITPKELTDMLKVVVDAQNLSNAKKLAKLSQLEGTPAAPTLDLTGLSGAFQDAIKADGEKLQ